MLNDWRLWFLVGVGCLLWGWLFPILLPVGPVTALLTLLALFVLGWQLGSRLGD
jgi:hypothetical protein